MSAESLKKWVGFYKPFFPSERLARDFVVPFEALPLGDPRHPAKIMMHQVQRLVSLADDIPSIRKGNETLPLLFLLICVEDIAKLCDDFVGEGQSKAYVRNFFEWFLLPQEQKELCIRITNHEQTSLSLRDAVDMFYDVRCDIVHEGKYWGFHFQCGATPMMSCDPDVTLSLSLKDFRGVVVRGCIKAIRAYPRKPSTSLNGDAGKNPARTR